MEKRDWLHRAGVSGTTGVITEWGEVWRETWRTLGLAEGGERHRAGNTRTTRQKNTD